MARLVFGTYGAGDDRRRPVLQEPPGSALSDFTTSFAHQQFMVKLATDDAFLGGHGRRGADHNPFGSPTRRDSGRRSVVLTNRDRHEDQNEPHRPHKRLPEPVVDGSALSEGPDRVDDSARGLIAREGLKPSGHGRDGDDG